MTTSAVADKASSAENSSARIKQRLSEGALAEALRTAEDLCQHDPTTENLYLLAVCQRYNNQFDSALETLEKLESLSPGYGRLWQERGHIYARQQDRGNAVKSYLRAVRFNPALAACWRGVRDLGSASEKQLADKQLNYLQRLPKTLLTVTSLLHENNVDKAEQICRAFLQQQKHHPEAMRLLAMIAMERNIYDEAQFLLESVLELYPDQLMARHGLIEVLQKRQNFQAAYDQALALFNNTTEEPALGIQLANQALAVGHYDEAIELYQRFLSRAPAPETVYLSLGHTYKTSGLRDLAIDNYRKAYRERPDFGDAYWSLANLKTFRFSDTEIDSMMRLESLPETLEEDKTHLCFALGKALEDREKFDQSYEYYRRGNALKKATGRYSADWMSREFETQRDACTPELFEKHRGDGCLKSDPIFILGLPRAGSTLLEQIISSHSQVDGTLELPNILMLSQRLRRTHGPGEGSGYPAALANMPAEKMLQFGEEYLKQTSIYRQRAPFFIDKMPNNFRHIGLIKLILPNAKIIDARRHPMACGFSLFKQLFAEGQEFSYDFEDIGRYYADYVELMEHWHRVLPNQILHVQYEEIIEDFDTQVRRILDYCNLPFESNCVEFYKTERAVRTASSEQVRQPLNRQGLEQWRHFEPYLQPLKTALGRTLEDSRYLPHQPR